MNAQALDEYLGRPYSKVLVADEGGGYVAEVMEFPGCIAEGETPDEAIRNLDNAMEAWIEAVLDSGKPVPEPLALQGYSGRFVLRMPKWVHKEAVRRAQADGVSLNQWVVEAIAERLGAEKYSDRLMEKAFSALTRSVVATDDLLSLLRLSAQSLERDVNVGFVKCAEWGWNLPGSRPRYTTVLTNLERRR